MRYSNPKPTDAPRKARVSSRSTRPNPDALLADTLLADPFHERSPPRARFTVDILGGRFEIESNDPRLLQLGRAAFGGLPAHRLGRRVPRLRLTLMVTGGANGSSSPEALERLCGGGLLGAVTPASSAIVVCAAERCAWVVVSPTMLRSAYHTRYELIEFAAYTLACRAQNLVPLHAACVGWKGRGVLIIGDSGAGKSTLTLHCLLAGFDFLAEDSLFVTPDHLRATGLASFVHLRREGLRFLAGSAAAAQIRKSPVIRRRSGVRKLEVDLRKLGYPLAAQPLRIAAVVLASARRAAEQPLIRPVRQRRLLNELQITQPYAAAIAPGWAQFKRQLAQVPAYELLRGAHPRDSVRCLRTLLSTL